MSRHVGAAPRAHLWLLVAGLAASAVGLAGLAYALFGPAYATMECRSTRPAEGTPTEVCETGNETLLDQDLDPRAAVFLVFVGGLFAAVGAWAVCASRTGARVPRPAIVAATGLLAIGTFLSILSVGPMFLPGLLLAIWASWEAVR